MDETSILRIAPYILKRFEQNLDDGVLFLYNVNTNDNWTGNASSFYLINLIDSKRTLKEIYTKLVPLFENYNYEEIKQSFDDLLIGLIKKGFLEVVFN